MKEGNAVQRKMCSIAVGCASGIWRRRRRGASRSARPLLLAESQWCGTTTDTSSFGTTHSQTRCSLSISLLSVFSSCVYRVCRLRVSRAVGRVAAGGCCSGSLQPLSRAGAEISRTGKTEANRRRKESREEDKERERMMPHMLEML